MLAYNNIEARSINPLLLRRTKGSSSGGNVLIERQNIRHWTNWCDRVRVDLLVRLCVVALDVSEFGGALEGIIVPVQVAHPPGKKYVRMISLCWWQNSTYLCRLG
jgi:hypothetical protein